MPFNADFTLFSRGQNRAAWLVAVGAVVKFARSQEGLKLGEPMLDFHIRQMVQPEILEAGRVDNFAALGQVVQPGGGGRVFAGVKCRRMSSR